MPNDVLVDGEAGDGRQAVGPSSGFRLYLLGKE